MGYILGKRSMSRLKGLHPDLVLVVRMAIGITKVDFTVLEGLRTLERQKKLKAARSSKILNSRHLTGHAVDLGAWVDGQVDWSWSLYYPIATAMQTAGRQLDVPLVWGGVWDKSMSEYSSPALANANYIARRQAKKQRIFVDGPHFELPRADYPDKW